MNMRAFSAIMLSAAVVVTLSGCSSIKKLTGQRNDSTLPGQREEILSPDQTKAQNPDVLNQDGAGTPGDIDDPVPCDPNVEACGSGIDQEAGTEG
jgi:hypothetical protein